MSKDLKLSRAQNDFLADRLAEAISAQASLQKTLDAQDALLRRCFVAIKDELQFEPRDIEHGVQLICRRLQKETERSDRLEEEIESLREFQKMGAA